MAEIIYTQAALDDLERLTEFLLEASPEEAIETTNLIISAIETLADHPLIGRPVESQLRELVISRGRSGYIALYQLENQESTALILGIRHQREAGFPDVDHAEPQKPI